MSWFKVFAVLLALGLAALLAAPIMAQDDDPLSVANALVAAANADDTNAQLAMFADDAVVTLAGFPGEPPDVFTGKTEIWHGFILNDTGTNFHIELVEDPQVAGDTVSFTAMITDDFTAWAGVAGFTFTGEIVVQNGKIVSFDVNADLASFEAIGPTIGARFQQLFAGMAGVSGSVVIRDSTPGDYIVKLGDMGTITITGVPDQPPDSVWEGWLVSDDGTRPQSTGVITVNPDGTVDQSLTLPPPARSITITMEEQNDSGQSGTATLSDMRGMTNVVVNVIPAAQSTGSDPHPIHIHFGRCGSDLLLGVDEPLTGVVNSESFTLVDVDLATLMDGHHAINVHKSGAEAGIYTSCGNIPTPEAPTGENLFASFDKFVITIEPVPDPDPLPSEQKIMIHQIPKGGIVHIRHLAYSWTGNPVYASGFHQGEPKGITVGLREQAWVALVHARLAMDSTTLAGIRRHAEHVINAIEGTGDRGGPNYGDLNKDGNVEDFGDGFGVLNYAADAAKHARSPPPPLKAIP